MAKECIYCGETLSHHNVYMYEKRKDIVDKCERCTDRLEAGYDIYP